MPVQIELQTARLISVHEEPEPLLFYVPNVHPGRYEIPGIDWPAEKMAELAVEHRADNERVGRMIPYAKVGELGGVKYVLIEVVEAMTYTQNPAKQSHDRFGQPKVPDVLVVGEPVRAGEVANEIERNWKHMGITTIEGDEPTAKELAKAMNLKATWERQVIIETNKWYKTRLGERQVTDQARRIADRMYRRKMLPTLPEWAMVNPSATADLTDKFHCICGELLRKDTAKCGTCQAIHNWPKAVEFGLVKLSEVPPMHRASCGLPPLSDTQTEKVPGPVAQGKKAKEAPEATAT